MIANVSPHRRANAFAQALEDRTPSGLSEPEPAAEQPEAPAETAEHGRLLALASALGELPRPEMDPQAKVVQRAQLVAAMEAMVMEERAGGGAASDPQVPEQRTGRGAHRASPLRKMRPRSRWSKGIAAGGLTVGVAAGAFSGVAAASSDALPGETLYPLKRGMEDIKRGMADDDSDRGELYLTQASTRLSEARRLMDRGKSGQLDHEDLSEIRRALAGVKHDAAEAHRLLHLAYERDGSLGPIQALNAFSRSHRDAWGKLRSTLPPQLNDVGEQVSSVFDAIEQDVAPLQGLLPKPPEQTRGSSPGGGGTPAKQNGPSGTQPSARPSTPGQSGAATPAPAAPSDAGKPSGGGLLGGGTDGLLKPPPVGTAPSPTGPVQEPQPDITLPPLLPGLLPGLGISQEDAG
ncbi:DUF5667 domain-containing protein [Streptomyces sp. NPDC012888]|uniref:DUF5667 domain-containing protein n=1 Tax=Streptomyces sp. NPDC012888 TaxID=3364855 RepID=UPI00367C686D